MGGEVGQPAGSPREHMCNITMDLPRRPPALTLHQARSIMASQAPMQTAPHLQHVSSLPEPRNEVVRIQEESDLAGVGEVSSGQDDVGACKQQ